MRNDRAEKKGTPTENGRIPQTDIPRFLVNTHYVDRGQVKNPQKVYNSKKGKEVRISSALSCVRKGTLIDIPSLVAAYS